MLTHFEVSNFKSLKDLNIDLRRFMVLVGPNGAGKTNLVRALEILGELLSRGTVEPIQVHGYDQLIRREKRPARGLYFSLRTELPPYVVEKQLSLWSTVTESVQGKKPELPSGPFSLEVSIGVMGSIHADEVIVTREEFRLQSNQSELIIIRNEHGNTIEPGNDPNLWHLVTSDMEFSKASDWIKYLRNPNIDAAKNFLSNRFNKTIQPPFDPQLLLLVNWQRRPSAMMQYLRDITRVTRLRLDATALRRDFAFEEPRESLLGPTGEGLASAVAKLRGPKPSPSPQFRKVLEALQEVYPRIEDVIARRIPSGHLMLLFKERGISEELGQGSISDGVLHALALLVALNQVGSGQPGLLAIEEPENAIHPWPLRKLIARAQQSARQIILTTHSETVVNAVNNPETLYLVENDDKRGTVVTQATAREAALKAILEESGQRLGDVWLDGSLGGVPGADS
ncbi:AAA family ATPase [Archangium sp.]|uniref:AAA family ATPase n=1 Tax=Archangium sp. TaxID=1872627 RepID=UPI00286D10D9|nr:AAA family ATPase [Archangium sp.]